MKATLSEVARLVGGKVLGDPLLEIEGISSPELAGPRDITFIVSPKHEKRLKETKAKAVMVPNETLGGEMDKVVVTNVYLAYAKVASFLNPPPEVEAGISPEVWIHPEATVGKDVRIYPFVWVGRKAKIGDRVTIFPMVCVGEGCQVGEGCVLHSGVVLYPGCILGKRVIIHSGAVIGSDGFGYARDGDVWVKIPQLGTVRIEDDVEIGANVTIDRASFGETVIRRGVKIDNLVQVGHNVEIGEDSILAGQVGLAGSVKLGKGVMLAGQVGVANHVRIGDRAVVGSKSGVAQEVPEGSTVSGIPAIPHRSWLRATQAFEKLPELIKRLNKLEKRLEALERKGGEGKRRN